MLHVKQFRKIDFFTVKKAKKKSVAAQEALNRLNAFLNAAEPEPVFWLNQLWTDQQNAITYKELREAILAGGLDPKTLEAWQKDYASFANEHLKPIWTQAMQAGAAKLEAEHPDFFFDTLSEGVTNWTSTHGAEWVTNISAEQQEAITAMIDKVASGSWTVDEMARAIRPTIGLTKPQSLANLNYYNRVRASAIDNGFSETVAKQKAQEAALKYAGRQHRARAYSIATTELAFAYNKGNDDGVKQAKRIPTADIQAAIVVFTQGSTSGNVATKDTPGVVKPGDGLTVGEDGTLSLDLGSGLALDETGKVQVDTETVVTGADMVNEEEVKKDVADILNGEDDDANI